MANTPTVTLCDMATRCELPAALLQHVSIGDGGHSKALHRTRALCTGFEQHLGIVVVSGSANNGARTTLRFFWRGEGCGIAHEYPRADEHCLGAKLTDQ